MYKEPPVNEYIIEDQSQSKWFYALQIISAPEGSDPLKYYPEWSVAAGPFKPAEREKCYKVYKDLRKKYDE